MLRHIRLLLLKMLTASVTTAVSKFVYPLYILFWILLNCYLSYDDRLLLQLDERTSVDFQATLAHPALRAELVNKVRPALQVSRDQLDLQDLEDSRDCRVSGASPDQLDRPASRDFSVETETRATLAIPE